MNESLHLYIMGNRALLRRRKGLFGRGTCEDIGQWTWVGAFESSFDFEAVSANLKKRQTLNVYVGSCFCKFLVADLPEGVTDKEAPSVAAAQMAHKLGLNLAEWEFTAKSQARAKKCLSVR
jgi:hypothetical protein